MKKIIFISFILFNFFNFNLTLAKIESRIVAKIENKIVTNFEIKNKILSSLILSNLEISQKNIDKFKKQSLEFLIQTKLKEIELSKYNIKIDNNRLNSYLNSISSNDITALKQKFEAYNLDFELFTQNIQTDLKWKNFIFSKYSKKIEIDENSVLEEIEKIKKNRSVIKEYNLSEIEVNLENDQPKDEIILSLKDKIKNIGFEETALQYSISSTASNKGSLGWVNSEGLSDNIKLLLKKMDPGTISEPIEISQNLLFLKLNDTRIIKSEEIDLDKLKKNIIIQRKNDLFDLYSNSYLSKLKNTSLIEYK